MKRRVFSSLADWAQRPHRKPLILMGARQVGKTFALESLGKQSFENVVQINFEETPQARSIFDQDLNPTRIITDLSLFTNAPIHPDKTLIIFDEVQEAPKALTSLKYFCEKAANYHIAAAGSLLGLKLPKGSSFPVGKVEFIDIHPFSFLEYLEACGNEELSHRIREIPKLGALSNGVHEKCVDLLKTYFFLGGMPEGIANFIGERNYTRVREIQNAILTAYQLDISKHAPASDIQKIYRIWESLPSQLARENKRFILKNIASSARNRDYENALQWLTDAALTIRCERVNAGRNPLSAYVEEGVFKLYAIDVGLLGALAGLSAQVLVQNEGIFTEFKGAFVENFVAQELKNLGLKCYYWHSEGKAEVDFVVEIDSQIVPIEVKAGGCVRSQSHKVFTKNYSGAKPIRFSLKNYQETPDIINVPLYATEIVRQLI